MLTINTNGSIILDGNDTGLHVKQTEYGTFVYIPSPFKQITMPQPRYSLATDNPDSGIPGRSSFERDLREHCCGH